MITPTAEAQAPAPASIATASPELFRHDFNEHGVCTNPETIAIPGMPKKTRAEIQLAIDPEGAWRMGFDFAGGGDNGTAGGGGGPSLASSESFPDRISAIRAALVILGRPFLENAKATRALEAYYASVKAAEASPVVGSLAPGSLFAKCAAGEKAMAERKAGRFSPLPKGRFAELPVSSIQPNPENHRKTFDPVAAAELLASIREQGQLQPIAVRLLSPEELGELPGVGAASPALRHEIILGERRWRAHVAGEIPTIEAKIYEGVSRQQAKAAALVENLQREKVNPMEEAEGFADLIATEMLTQEECAERVGRSRPAVANSLRLLKLPEGVREFIRRGELTPAHGHALAKWEARPLVMKAIAERAIAEGVSAGVLEDFNRAGGIPFQKDLESAGILFIVTRWNRPGGWDRDFPAEIVKHADYEARDGGEQYVCYAPQHWQEVCARELAQIEAERAAAVAAQKAPPAPAAKPTKIRTVEDLPRNSYAYLLNPGELAGLLPTESVMKLPDRAESEKGGKVEQRTVCLVPKFAERVIQAMQEAKFADRAEKMPAILEKARLAVRKWKRVGPRELALLSFIMLSSGDYYDGAYPALAPSGATGAGLKLPVCFSGLDCLCNRRWPKEVGKGLRTIAEGDAIGYIRAQVDHFLVTSFLESGSEWDGVAEPGSEEHPWCWQSYAWEEHEGPLLCHVLNVEELGLLEETRAGLKQLQERVRALPWYAEELAKAKKAGEPSVADAAGVAA